MDQAEVTNWKAIAESMEAKGDTRVGSTSVLAPSLMASQTQCPSGGALLKRREYLRRDAEEQRWKALLRLG